MVGCGPSFNETSMEKWEHESELTPRTVQAVVFIPPTISPITTRPIATTSQQVNIRNEKNDGKEDIKNNYAERISKNKIHSCAWRFLSAAFYQELINPQSSILTVSFCHKCWQNSNDSR